MIIAIDGLGVNGKTTLASRLALDLGMDYVNTGAIYRAIALYILENGLDINDLDSIIPVIRSLDISFIGDRTILNAIDITERIKQDDISYYSTKWATIERIKETVREIQYSYIHEHDVVIEGRDIGVRIAPDADFKFYLFSSFERRAERLARLTNNESIVDVRKKLQERDILDINGGNFIKPSNAYEIDTTDLTLDEVYSLIMKRLNPVRKVKSYEK